MDELMDLLVKDESPNQISDAIKELLYAKTAEKVSAVTPKISGSLFDDEQPEVSAELDVEQDVDAESDGEVEVEQEPEEEQV
tara:strand:- start:1705 stop:1950 length:246 start_codon:yes stop_codon:yes gene_type:complete